MFVQCRNPECKDNEKCRKPAFTFSEEYSCAKIRAGKQRYTCADCGSDFVDIEQNVCFVCSSESPSRPQKMNVNTVCAECKSAQCRVLKDFVVNDEEDECPFCGDDIEEGMIMVCK